MKHLARCSVWAGALAFTVRAAPVRAAEFLPLGPTRGPVVLGSLAMEPELTVGAGMLFPVLRNEPGVSLGLGAGVKWAALLPQRGDLRLHIGAAGRAVSSAGWGAACLALGFVARAENDAAVMYGLGLELRCQPSYFHASWAWGLDLGWQAALSTHVSHSAIARRTFDDRYGAGVSGVTGPRDGWYGWTSTRFRAGLAGSHRFGEHWSGVLALGSLFALQEQGVLFAFNLGQLPVYLELSAAYLW